MNEFNYEVQQKKRIANSARYKKGGSKSKRCTLPSDRLTDKQIRERHGKTMVYNLTKPMSWEQFKEMPLHAQSEYLENLNTEFGATAADISKMFGVNSSTVVKHTKAKNIATSFARGHRMNKEQRQIWEAFLNETSKDLPEEDDTVAESIDTQTEELSQPKANEVVCVNSDDSISKMNMSEINLKFNGVIDITSVANSLRSILGNNAQGSIVINFQSNMA